MKVRRKEILDAVQWFKLGDHPKVIKIPKQYNNYNPVLDGATGFIDGFTTGASGIFIFPGDYIIFEGSYFIDIIRADDFNNIFEIVKE